MAMVCCSIGKKAHVMKQIIVIVAYSIVGRIIGKDGKLPWRLRSDLQHFMETTLGHIVIMGRKTYESLPNFAKPLRDRINIIISSDPDYVPTNHIPDQTFVCSSYEEAIELAMEMHSDRKIFIGGGGEIYKLAMENEKYPVTKIIASEVKGEFTGDTVFPKIQRYAWHKEVGETYPITEGKDTAEFTIVQYILMAA
jgi:dihydrofolate reductase